MLDPSDLLASFGLLGLLLIVFAELGLLVGFFLPGDSLLFVAGTLVATGSFDVPLGAVIVLVPIAATAGSLAGYWVGRTAGPALFARPKSRLFRPEHLRSAQNFFDRRGPAAIVAARFVPVVRTFITVVAGASRMRLPAYTAWSVLVSVVWGAGLPLAGYALGSVDLIAQNLTLVSVVIVLVSCAPVGAKLLRRVMRGVVGQREK